MGSSCLGDSLSISLFFFTSFPPEVQPCTPRLPVLPLAALSLPSATPLAGDTQKKFVPNNSNRQPQPANLRVKSRMVGGCKKEEAEETAFSDSVFPIVLVLNQTDRLDDDGGGYRVV